MKIQDLKAKLERHPFRPFIIELNSGSQILIDAESEILFPRKRPELVIVFTRDRIQHEFEDQAITRLAEVA
jgi:hypothetical protein